MSILGAIFMGLREVWANKLRSFLTLFCVLLGVASVVVTVGYMTGLTAQWKERLRQGGGVEKLTVEPFRVPEEQAELEFVSPGHTTADAEAVRRFCSHIRYLSPVVEVDRGAIYRGRRRDRTDVEAIVPEFRFIENFAVRSGRFISDLDLERASQVMVIGQAVYERLFEPGENPVGQTVLFEGMPFEIVGLLENYELNMGRYNALHWKNDKAFIPLTTAQRRINGDETTSGMEILLTDAAYLPVSVDSVGNVVRAVHRGIEDFRISTNQEWSDNLAKQERNQVTTGAAVSLITIIIGGIGIMNLMLASINERVREIGIRKAIGARSHDIFLQFSVESVTLCVLGGLLGVAAGQGVIHLLRESVEDGPTPVYTVLGVAMGFSASVVIGLLAGIYPAVKAARMDPIEALRHE